MSSCKTALFHRKKPQTTVALSHPLLYTEIMKARAEIRLRIGKEKNFIGKGVREILDAIDEHKSIKKACQATGISYPKVMRILKTLKTELGFAAVVSEKGGSRHGGTELSEKGRAVLECFREIESEVALFAQKRVREKFRF